MEVASYKESFESALESFERETDKSSRKSRFAVLIMAFPPFWDTEDMAYHIRETFKWHLRRSLRPPRPLPEDYRDLCPSFTLPDAEEVAHDFNILTMVQATFYSMLLNNVAGLSLVSRDIARCLKATHEGLQWTAFESWLHQQACPPRGAAPPMDSFRRRPWARGGGKFGLK